VLDSLNCQFWNGDNEGNGGGGDYQEKMKRRRRQGGVYGMCSMPATDDPLLPLIKPIGVQPWPRMNARLSQSILPQEPMDFKVLEPL
jgi:hypothetical protein